MTKTSKFGSRSTADEVLAGIDLKGKCILVTGCDTGLGFETVSALAANGAHVIAAADRLDDAERACRESGYDCSPLACDLGDLASIAAAGENIRRMPQPLDAFVANSGIRDIAPSRVPCSVEEHFLANHLGHFALLKEVSGALRDAGGRVVLASAVSDLANAVYAKELSRRLDARGISVNSADAGKLAPARHGDRIGLLRRLALKASAPFRRAPAQAAASVVLLAAHPDAEGVTGEYWQNCQVMHGHPLVQDTSLAARLWNASEALIAKHCAAKFQALPQAA